MVYDVPMNAEQIPQGVAIASALDDHLLVLIEDGEITGDAITGSLDGLIDWTRIMRGLDA